METKPTREARRPRSILVPGLLAGGAFLVATGCLVLLLWRYVPTMAARLAFSDAPLPLSTRLVIAASTWTVRLLPLMILVGAPLCALVLVGVGVLAAVRPTVEPAVRTAITVLAVCAGLEILACGFVVYAMGVPASP